MLAVSASPSVSPKFTNCPVPATTACAKSLSRGLSVAGLLALVSIEAIAQASSAPSTEEGLRRQEERSREQEKSLQTHADALKPAASHARLPELPDERPCFVIREIALVGKDADRFRWLGPSTDGLLGRCIGSQGVALTAAYLNAQLTEQGYVTSRVGVGSQNLADGRLTFDVLAGRISEVRMVDAATRQIDTRWGTWVNAFPTSSGRLLDARALEQGVEQMKRLPSQSVTTTLAPGTEPDTSILTIERQTGGLAERVRGGLTLDNSGSPSLGRTQFSASVALDNPLGLNDIASLSVNGNAEHPSASHRSQSASLNYGIPFGYSTFSANFSHSRYAQNVALTTTSVLNTGESDTTDLKWEHVAWRTASTKTGVYVDVSTRKSRSFLDDSENVAQGRHTTFVERGVTFRQLFAGGESVDVALAYRRGVAGAGAQDDLPPEAGVTLRPRIWIVNASAVIPIKQPAQEGWAERNWQYSMSLHGQFTPDATTSIDQLSIGSRGTVRGFDGDNVLLAESGWFVRNELSTPLPTPALEASFYAGVDWGRVWGPSAINLLGHHLGGVVLGVRGKVKSMQFDLALAAPLVKPEGFKTARVTPYVSATYAF